MASRSNLFKEPWTYLFLQAVSVFVFLSWNSGTHPRIFGDSLSYVNFPIRDPLEALDSIRTFGYPLFLHIVRTVFPDLRFLPQIQISIYFAATFFFYASCRAYGFPRWVACLAASPLLYQRILWDYSFWVYTEVPAAALAVLSIGFLMRAVAGKRPVLNWAGLILSVFLAYQVRPVCLFLVPLVPVLALLFHWLKNPPLKWDRASKRLLAKSAAASLLPLILFCTVRLAVVGSFGLVSFTGVNIIGITTQFMTREMVRNFDADLRPFALAMIERRDSQGLGIPSGRRMIDMPEFLNYYRAYTNDLFYPLTQQFVDGKVDSSRPVKDLNSLGKDSKPIEVLGRRLALATMKARPGIFAYYYYKAFLWAIGLTLYVQGAIIFLALATLATYLVSILRQPGEEIFSSPEPRDDADLRARNVLIYLAAFFYFAKLVLTITVEAPDWRYLVAASVFVHSALVVTLFCVAKKAFPRLARIR